MYNKNEIIYSEIMAQLRHKNDKMKSWVNLTMLNL